MGCGKRSHVLLHKLLIVVYEDCATDGRTRDARLDQGLRIRAVLVDKHSNNRISHLLPS